jgi:hypothetical protein
MKQRFYIDTSVWGGLFDKVFALETGLLFDLVKMGQIICLYSDLTENELIKAPARVRSFFTAFPASLKEKVVITPEILNLATTYVNENVVGNTSFDDCLHIAAATVHRADMLISWNFKHIVNVYRVRGYNAINMRLGYPTLNIHSPKEIVGYGN